MYWPDGELVKKSIYISVLQELGLDATIVELEL